MSGGRMSIRKLREQGHIRQPALLKCLIDLVCEQEPFGSCSLELCLCAAVAEDNIGNPPTVLRAAIGVQLEAYTNVLVDVSR